MDGILGGASDGRGALHHVGIAYRPFIGLLCAHGAADDQRETFQAEFFRDKFVLRAHVIPDAHMRENFPSRPVAAYCAARWKDHCRSD